MHGCAISTGSGRWDRAAGEGTRGAHGGKFGAVAPTPPPAEAECENRVTEFENSVARLSLARITLTSDDMRDTSVPWVARGPWV